MRYLGRGCANKMGSPFCKMIVMPTATLLLLVALLHSSNANIDIKQIYENPLSHGFGEDIDWVKWEDAVETALERDKPIFLLIHKSWCHACKALKKTFQQSNARKAFKVLSEYFVMVNTEDDEEPYEEEYRPDGKYIPRLLFLDKNGDLLPEFVNKKAEYKNYAYYYSSPADVLNSMKDVLESLDIEVPQIKKGEKLKRRPRSDDEPNETEKKEDGKKARDEKKEKGEKKPNKETNREKATKEEKKGDKERKKSEL